MVFVQNHGVHARSTINYFKIYLIIKNNYFNEIITLTSNYKHLTVCVSTDHFKIIFGQKWKVDKWKVSSIRKSGKFYFIGSNDDIGIALLISTFV